ncbi:MAG: ATP-binding protein [Caldimicrobium sp.]|nr:ATP-binding protein [Caldimicrobium sp.]
MVTLLINGIFRVYKTSLEKALRFLKELPFRNGELLPMVPWSRELQELKAVGEELSKLLKEQDILVQQERDKLEEILKTLHEGIVVTDFELKIKYFNQAFYYIVESLREQDIRERRLDEVLPLYDEKREINYWQTITPLLQERLLEHQISQHSAYYFINGNSKVIDFELAPLKSEYWQGYLFVCRDVTKEKLIERELSKIEKFEAIDRLAGGVAHDLRNILAGIYNYFYLLKSKPISEIYQNKDLQEKIENLLNRATVLSNQLLTLSKGGVPLKGVGDLKQLISDIADFCFSGFPVEFELVVNAPVERILFDPYQMGQVFQNLFINAREAMPEGGKVTVNINLRHLGEEEIPPLSKGTYVEISVRDTGMGIAPEILPKIFDPFFSTKEKGSGLGLTTSFQIVRNHGGHIRVESQKGKGTTFYVYLPYEVGQEKLPVEEPETLSITFPKLRILVVDDEADIREGLQFILQDLGHEVATAGRATEAIEIFQKSLDQGKPFDLVITDYTMPELTGDQLLLRLKEIYPNFKSILSTGYTDIPIITHHKTFGFDAYLLKPYTIENLLKILREVSNQK